MEQDKRSKQFSRVHSQSIPDILGKYRKHDLFSTKSKNNISLSLHLYIKKLCIQNLAKRNTFKREFIAKRISFLTDLQFSISVVDVSSVSYICAEIVGSSVGFTEVIHSS